MTRLLSTVTLPLMMLVLTTGCSISEDRHVHESTAMAPKVSYVADEYTQETVWSYEVPPGHILVVDFDHGGETFAWSRQDPGGAEKFDWYLYRSDASPSRLKSNHYSSEPVEKGSFDLDPARSYYIGYTIGAPIDVSAAAAADRTIQEIEQDLLPEPTVGGDDDEDHDDGDDDDNR